MPGKIACLTMRLPRYTTLQLLLVATFAALVLGLFTSASRLGTVQSVQHVCFSPNGKFLAASYSGGMVRVWRMDDDRPRLAVQFHANIAGSFPVDYPRMLHFEDERQLLLIDPGWPRAGHTWTVRSFALATGLLSDPFLTSRPDGISLDDERPPAKTSANKCAVASRDQKGVLGVRDVSTGRTLMQFAGERKEPFALSGDGSLVATIGLGLSETPSIVILNGNSGAVLEYAPFSSAAAAYWMEFSRDGSVLAVGGPGGVECYDTKLKTLMQRFPRVELRARHDKWGYPQQWSRYLALAPDGKTLVSSDGNGVFCFDVELGTLRNRLGGDSRAIRAVIFIAGLVIWAAAWGIVGKRGRWPLSTPHAPPLGMQLCWGLMIIGGTVAVGIPTVSMFLLGPLLFPTVYCGLLVGLVAIARGAGQDTQKLRHTAALQVLNLIALDPTNTVFAAIELTLLRTTRVREYLRAMNGPMP